MMLMKIYKKLIIIFSVILLMAVLFMPFAVYADDELDDPVGESAIPNSPKAFTPDGQATVVDLSYESDGKMFYTFKTPAGNVFYLVIDRERITDNVYFLNAVTEQDLVALAKKAGEPISVSAIPTTELSTTEQKPDETFIEPEIPPPKQKSNSGLLIFLLIGVLALGGAGYYFKIIRPKQRAGLDDDDEDDISDDDGDDDEIEFEDDDDE